MKADDVQSGSEVRFLKDCINDLIVIQALPAIWNGGQPGQIVSTLLDVLVGMLRLDFAYVQLKDSIAGAPFEIVRLSSDRSLPIQPQEIGRRLNPWLGAAPRKLPLLVPNPIGEGDVSIVPLPMGQRNETGVFVAASIRGDFPTPTEKLVLNTAANQAVMALQEVRRFCEKEQLAHELDQRVAQRTRDVVTVNEELRKEIIQRKRAEQELQQLVDFVPQYIVVLSPDGEWTYANRVAREYTRMNPDEHRSVDLIGRAIHPDDAEKMRAARERGLSGSDPFEIEARLQGADGVYRWFLFRYNPLVEEGCVRRWYATGTEIESRKQQEERVRQENVRLGERTRIAQELHDTLLQSFLGASMRLGAAMKSLPSDSSVRPKLDSILQLMEQGIDEGRNAIQGLRSSAPQTVDLVVALSAVPEEFSAQLGVDFRVSVVGCQHLVRSAIQHEIYRIGKEALVNAFSHSGAKRIDLELEYTDSLTIRVRDNGCGIDPRMLDTGREGHWGLAGMRERATKIGGQFKISSATDGTEVQLSVPGGVAFQRSSPDYSP